MHYRKKLVRGGGGGVDVLVDCMHMVGRVPHKGESTEYYLNDTQQVQVNSRALLYYNNIVYL